MLDVPPLKLRILDQSVQVDCVGDEQVAECLRANFGALTHSAVAGPPDLAYSVFSANGAFLLEREDTGLQLVSDGLDDLVYDLEKDLTIDLQRRRSDLLFLHAAVIERQGAAIALAADSGSGKSTTAWALLHHGFRYLSDELAPIDPATLQVFGYPHALCLKRPPPPPYDLPAATQNLGRTLHVPVAAMPSEPAPSAVPLGAIFLVRHDPTRSAPGLRRLSTAEASARIYVNALNALAHPDRGLSVVSHIAERVPCFALDTAGLGETCEVIRSALEQGP